MRTVNAGVMEGNHFTRSASDKIVVTASNISWLKGDATDLPITVGQSVQRQMGRQIAVDFANNLVIQNNRFDVSDGVLLHNLNGIEVRNNSITAKPGTPRFDCQFFGFKPPSSDGKRL